MSTFQTLTKKFKNAYFDQNKVKKKMLVPEGDIFACHAPGTLAILTKSLKNDQNS